VDVVVRDMGLTIDADAAALEPIVAAATARCLRLPAAIVGRDVPFARLGLDSLGCLELAGELETALGMPVPADAVLECTTVRSLCAALTGTSGAALTAPAGAFDRMRADAVLAADIRPRPFSGAVSLTDARHVLLTGATGFLGSALLELLLTRTQAHVTCLVRGPQGAELSRSRAESADKQRAQDDVSVPDPVLSACPRSLREIVSVPDPALSARPRSLREIVDCSAFSATAALARHADRIDFVRGDLMLPSAGLSRADWARLTGDVDAVCHAGASINWVAGYDALRDVNVLATRELLRLAAEAGASFHFISSVAVCYSTTGPRTVDERHDPLDAIEGLHFGYAQSKAVSESLVRQAAARGIPARIYRPALISGDSRTGRFNPDDMLSRLIAGCVWMRAAPDLDWRLDALPVDSAAALILALSGDPSAGAWHLAHPRPRHWRECVLWMRLYGYDVTLLPYREWTARLRETTADASHPLRPLRSFFLEEHGGGLTIPELHELSRASRLDAAHTHAAIAQTDVTVAPLDADLMDRYFTAFVESSTLPPPARRRPRHSGGIDARALGVTPFTAGHSIISELTAWQSGSACGLFHVPGPGGRPLVLKVTAHSDEVRVVGEALAGICGERLAAAYRELGGGLGSEGGHAREVALYRDADPILRAHTPAVIATHADPAARAWAVLLEDLSGATLLDSVDRPEGWTRDHIAAAVDGIAAIHGAWHARVNELRGQTWMAAPRTTASVQAMTPLWRALADHAAPMFAGWAGPSVPAAQRALIDRIAEWRPVMDAAPQTLVHNDFNPRNVCLRRAEGGPVPPKRSTGPREGGWRLCAFDWELAAIGTPMRDLAEFLCFVSADGSDRASIEQLIDRHAARFAAVAGVAVDAAAWRAAFAAALAEVLIDRLSVYAMVHRVRPQAFLPRVLRTWSSLHALFPTDGLAG
jgi:thioester reductase-like protein